ncbi:MAG: amidase [Hyphomicrobiales bacterium]|nr:MAG: amidase [Hyphomicrobiales bacterium]
MIDVEGKTAAQLGALIDAGKLDSVELTQHYLDAIGASEYGAEIYVRTTPERALSEAASARDRAKSGTRKSRLDGVPVSWKDLFDTAGIETEAGSHLLAGRIPEKDCEVLRRATDAGCICLGKTHMSELAFSGLGVNPRTATPPNRYDPARAPGGSSSGAAASVSYDLAPIGIGSDTGGSVRLPSGWNGLVGLKTTLGVVPTDGVVPLCRGFDTVGPLARSVEDAALMHEILSGNSVDIGDVPDLSDCRFLICETTFLDGCEPLQLEAFETAVAKLEKAGAKISRGPMQEVDEVLELVKYLFTFEAYREWGAEIEAHPDAVFEPVKMRFMGGKSVTQDEYLVAQEKMMEVRARYDARASDFDAVLAPTTANGPPVTQKLLADIDYFWDANLLALRNTRIGNLLGLCGLTLPTTTDTAGLMLLGKPNSDERLLQIGLACEGIVAA